MKVLVILATASVISGDPAAALRFLHVGRLLGFPHLSPERSGSHRWLNSAMLGNDKAAGELFARSSFFMLSVLAARWRRDSMEAVPRCD